MIYLKNGIKFKQIRKVIDFTQDYYLKLFKDMVAKINEAKERNERIIFVDEAIFSFNTFRKRAWSHKY